MSQNAHIFKQDSNIIYYSQEKYTAIALVTKVINLSEIGQHVAPDTQAFLDDNKGRMTTPHHV